MILSNSARTSHWLLEELTKKYDQLKITRGTIHNYLGMVFDLSQSPFILINQQGMIEDIVSSTKTSVNTATTTRSKVPPKTPAAPYLFDINTDSVLLPEPLQIIFHSAGAKLTYISTRTWQDLPTTISLLSKRGLHPTQEDWSKLQRALGYLENTKTQNLKLGMTIPLTIRTYITHHLLYTQITNLTRKCTSAWKLEFSMLNWAGRDFQTVSRGWHKSTAQKINTTSSCQAEMLALAKGFQQSIFSAYYVAGQGYPMPQIIVNQDNQSTIKLISNG